MVFTHRMPQMGQTSSQHSRIGRSWKSLQKCMIWYSFLQWVLDFMMQAQNTILWGGLGLRDNILKVSVDLISFNSHQKLNFIPLSVGFKTALRQSTEFISIESYNNFVHGTQIEPVLPFSHSKFKDYEHSPIKYLNLAQYWTNQFYKSKLDNQKSNKDKKICQHLLNNTIC